MLSSGMSSRPSAWCWLRVTHHSFQVGTAHDGLRAQKTVTSTREVEERVPHAGLRAQKAPPPGMRPGVLQDPAPQGRVGQHSGIGYELVLALDVPVLQMVEQPVDASALAFPEEIEANDLEVEYMKLVHDGFHKSPALTERMREVMRRRHVLARRVEGGRRRRGGRSVFLALLVLNMVVDVSVIITTSSSCSFSSYDAETGTHSAFVHAPCAVLGHGS